MVEGWVVRRVVRPVRVVWRRSVSVGGVGVVVRGNDERRILEAVCKDSRGGSVSRNADREDVSVAWLAPRVSLMEGWTNMRKEELPGGA